MSVSASTPSDRPAVVIFGAGGHARVVLDILERAGQYRVAGLLDETARGIRHGQPILGMPGDLLRLVKEQGIVGGIIAIGDNAARVRLAKEVAINAPDFLFIRAIHPQAIVAGDAVIGAGTVIAAGAVVGPGVRVGEHDIINTRASVDHDCELADFVSIAPGATLGGNIRVGEGAAVGLGAAVIQGMTIGEQAVVGAGAVVVKPVPESVVAYGNPARVVRSVGSRV